MPTPDPPPLILVVDDDSAVREVLRAALQSAGLRVLEAEDGREALRLLAQADAVRLVLLDQVMPGPPGHEVFRAMVAACPGVRCCFVTGFPDELPADVLSPSPNLAGVLAKPFSVATLLLRVREALAG